LATLTSVLAILLLKIPIRAFYLTHSLNLSLDDLFTIGIDEIRQLVQQRTALSTSESTPWSGLVSFAGGSNSSVNFSGPREIDLSYERIIGRVVDGILL
jgi:hypothetical protein